MITYRIENKAYATDENLAGFFSRPIDENGYNQHFGTGDIGFADEYEFEKFCRAYHKWKLGKVRSYPDVTKSGKFVWRK